MLKIKSVKQTKAKYEITFDDDEVFHFEVVFDREEYVLQGQPDSRYTETELRAITKVLKEMNTK